jgi:hypothetical protein
LAFIAEAKFASQKANYFPPNSEAFDETLFIRLPTLINNMTYRKIGKTNNMTTVFPSSSWALRDIYINS